MTDSDRLAPKVHPLDRTLEEDDPLEVVPNPVPGDPDLMLECLVDEYAQLGWDTDQLMALFRSPYYPLLNELTRFFGEETVRRRIENWLEQRGVFRVRETVVEEAADVDDKELIQLGIRGTD